MFNQSIVSVKKWCVFSLLTNLLQGNVNQFYIRDPRNRLQLRIFIFSIPVASRVDFMVARIGTFVPLLVGHFRPIRDTSSLVL